MKYISVLLVTSTFFAMGCDSKPEAPKAEGSAAVKATAAPAKTGAASAKADDGATCKALVTHIVEMQEASKKDGLINRKNLDKMVARCEKAGNLKDNKAAVACAMKAKAHADFVKCDGFGKVLGPW